MPKIEKVFLMHMYNLHSICGIVLKWVGRV